MDPLMSPLSSLPPTWNSDSCRDTEWAPLKIWPALSQTSASSSQRAGGPPRGLFHLFSHHAQVVVLSCTPVPRCNLELGGLQSQFDPWQYLRAQHGTSFLCIKPWKDAANRCPAKTEPDKQLDSVYGSLPHSCDESECPSRTTRGRCSLTDLRSPPQQP